MAEHDAQAFVDLFEGEPDQPSSAEIAQWTAIYARLVEVLDHQLVETRRLIGDVPTQVQEYLHRENVKILSEELEVFRDRLAYWRERH